MSDENHFAPIRAALLVYLLACLLWGALFTGGPIPKLWSALLGSVLFCSVHSLASVGAFTTKPHEAFFRIGPLLRIGLRGL